MRVFEIAIMKIPAKIVRRSTTPIIYPASGYGRLVHISIGAWKLFGENGDLHKRLAATLTIVVFLLSMFAVMAPAQAHFTLGSSSPVYPWTTDNFDPHVPGVIGYVWPGGGENTYLGTPTYVSSVVAPGYIAPYPSQIIGSNPTASGAYPANYLQVDAHEYAPFGAIVVDTTGDLIFAINATFGSAEQGFFSGGTWTDLYIAIPPEFTIPGVEQVSTTLTNNYANILEYKASIFDRYVPGWTIIRIIADPQQPIFFISDFLEFGEWYYIRVNGVKAPSIAGKYFFKMFLTSGGLASPDYWVPTENWPVLLVKGELDPAIITGTIRYGGYNASLYGKPIQQAGMVTAVMTTKLDPYTNQPIMGGTLTNAVAYFNGTDTDCLNSPSTCGDSPPPEGSGGHYEVEGVAPGIYDLYASAAGYPSTLIASGVTVLKGQSLHFDGYLNPGPVIHGDVYSKHAFGAEPWPFNAYIKIELYDSPTVDHVPSSNSTMVSWSPLPCVAGGQEYYMPGDSAADCGDPRYPGVLGTPTEFSTDYDPNAGIAFPWQDYTGGVGGVYKSLPAFALGTDPQGVGPAQNWFVKIHEDSFHYEFGAKGMYGAPTDLDGHVPQVFATWVNGLTAGRYYARAWVFRYVQSALDGSTFQEYSFEVSANEWAGDISLPIDLRISSWVNKTVHFHNNAGTLTPSSINTGAQYIVGKLVDAVTGTLYSYNVTTIGYASNPWDRAGLNEYCNTPGRAEFGSCNVQFWGINDTWLGENYGIPAGTYKPMVYALGYLQQTQDLVSVTLSGTPIQISNHLYRGVGFNFTVYSIDWERPRVNRNWVWPLQDVEIAIYNSTFGYVSQACDFCDGSFADNTVALPFTPPYPASGWTYMTALGSGGLVIPALQTPGGYSVEVEGKGWNVESSDGAAGVFFGLEAGVDTRVGGAMANHGPFATGSALNVWGLDRYYPSAFDSGQYYFQGWTYGYIQDKDFTVYANKGQVADIKINLIVGVNITVDIPFKKEGLISGTPYDMSARVRVFDDFGNLVATWMSSEGVYPQGSLLGTIDTKNSYRSIPLDLGPSTPRTAIAAYHLIGTGTDKYCFDEGFNFIPAGTELLHVQMAGLPLDWLDAPDDGIFHGGYGFGDPIFTPNSGNFEVNNWPADYWSLPNAHFPNEGILGQPDYTGTGWTVEVDFVNWYYGLSGRLTVASIDNLRPFTLGGAKPPIDGDLSPFSTFIFIHQSYPIVPGLLMGESYHVIPGTTASSGISLTEDGALDPPPDPYFLGHSMAANHLGPYGQQAVWSLPNAHLSGEVSGVWEVDLNGYVSGTALAFTWSNEFRSISWYTVTVTGATGMPGSPFVSYTNDGLYELYLTPGTYAMTLAGPGYAPTPMGSIAVTAGQGGTPGSGNNIQLPPTNIPVPEFSGLAVVAFSALAASLYLLRRKRR
jgi:hypothetical protein